MIALRLYWTGCKAGCNADKVIEQFEDRRQLFCFAEFFNRGVYLQLCEILTNTGTSFP